LLKPARNVTLTRPFTSVVAVAGWTVPRVVVKVIEVPEWGGVPADSRTCATMVVDPLAGSAVAPEMSVIVDPVGARSGTFSQAGDRMATARPKATLVVAQ